MYPSLTSYQYAQNNPLFFIDVNGDSTKSVDPNSEAGKKGIQFEETDAITATASRTSKKTVGGISANNGSKSSSANEIFPLATKDNSPLYQFIRGTGDISQDLNSFVVGVPALSFATVAGIYGGTYTVVTYGGQVIAVFSSYAGAASYALQRAYVGATTYGSHYVGMLSNKVGDVFTGYQNFYMINKPAIDNAARSIGASVSHAPNGVAGPTNKTLDKILFYLNPYLPW
jgi:hypothetical protein